MKQKTWRRVAIILLVVASCIFPSVIILAEGMGDSSLSQGRPLPPELQNLPTIVAEAWLEVDPDPQNTVLEGPAFDKGGNLYVCRNSPASPEQKILKIAPDKTITTIWQGKAVPTGLALHKDGRLFAVCLTGEILIMQPDGTMLETLTPKYNGSSMVGNDLVFDKAGNLYFTDFKGLFTKPIGGVYRLDAAGGYTKITQIINNLALPNGISLSPNGDVLWVAELGQNQILRAKLTAEGNLVPFAGVAITYRNTGDDETDSNRVDAAGNLYQGMMGGGRILVLNKHGVPVANIVVPRRDEDRNIMTPNLVIKPGTNEGYMMVAGIKGEGTWIYKFTALAEAEQLYSHQ
ncbi:MAG: putative lactonase precursor [Firmicutes bacterium]|nr:putative lactonase precursor [Bacillota bacterium]